MNEPTLEAEPENKLVPYQGPPPAVTPAQAKVDAIAGLMGKRGLHLIKHGMRYKPEYKIWCKMIERCENPRAINYERYGGRGITICESWRSNFLNFYADMGVRPSSAHSLERRNNLIGYSKENCAWATVLEQSNNKRNNVLVSFN